jgi:transcriptional regulator with XRE-family HTH domain
MKKLTVFLGFYPLPEPTTLAGHIRKYRHVRGLTLEEFGECMGMDGATVWTWENEKCVSNKSTARKIEELINPKELST